MDAGRDRGRLRRTLPPGGARRRPAHRPHRRRAGAGARRSAGAAAAMSALRFLTAGESHGKALTVIMDGVPAGLALTEDFIAADLRRRQGGYGRSQRQQIEEDRGEGWQEVMQVGPFEGDVKRVPRLRPGHADLAGAMKYGFDDVRDVLERASARETAARVAVGAVCRRLLEEFA